jgi:Fe-S cluster assembly ATP-binding protein
MDPTFAERSVNKGFSGGEKKKSEVLQMRVLQPRLALLDETDSGLDVDALKTVAEGVESMRGTAAKPTDEAGFSALIVTHYARILQYIIPDHIHVMVAGKIVESGGKELAQRLEKEGYQRFE